jgi:hypothetical protein
MNKSISTAKCIGEAASKARTAIYKSPNAAGKAMGMDPKTIRQIESGVAVRLTTIQSFAEHLCIPLDCILLAEDLVSLKHSRVLLDYITKDIFRNSNIIAAGQHDKYMAPAPITLGQPCDASSFIDLFSKMTIDPLEWCPTIPGPFIQPIWEIHESVPLTTAGLTDILEKLKSAIIGTVTSRKSSLGGVISQLKAHSVFQQLFEELDEKCGVHILGCIVETHVVTESIDYYERPVDISTHVKMPLFLIASSKVREFNLKYRHSLSQEDYEFQLEQLDPEDRSEFLDEIPF